MQTLSERIRLGWVLPIGILVGAVALYLLRPETPDPVRIATAEPGGLYQRFGEVFKRHLEKRTGSRVELVASRGSIENAAMIRERRVDLAVLQVGSVDPGGLYAIAPLYPDVIHLVVRRGSGIGGLADLSHEQLRGDRRFLIFLTQCSNLIRKIQSKLIQLPVQRRAAEEE